MEEVRGGEEEACAAVGEGNGGHPKLDQRQRDSTSGGKNSRRWRHEQEEELPDNGGVGDQLDGLNTCVRLSHDRASSMDSISGVTASPAYMPTSATGVTASMAGVSASSDTNSQGLPASHVHGGRLCVQRHAAIFFSSTRETK